MSRSRVDRLGQRLREGAPTEDDLRELSEYRDTFDPAYRRVLDVVRGRLNVEPTARKKTNESIIAKLRRQSIRLSRIQDIAGLRVVVPNVIAQDAAARVLERSFEQTRTVDRRIRPSHGYRAIHVIAFAAGLPVEIQVRTEWQQRWAELSERLSDVLGLEVKYGGGPEPVRGNLSSLSVAVADLENYERTLADYEGDTSRHGSSPERDRELHDVRRNSARLYRNLDWMFEHVAPNLHLSSGED